MQTAKASKPRTLDVPERKSPATTPRGARKLWAPGSKSSPVSSPNPANKSPKSQIQNVSERRSPRTPVNEVPKKRPGRISELESQLVQLEEDLKKTKEQVNTSESSKKQARQESEEMKKKQSIEINALEDSRIDELRKLSQERDKAWQSEIEALQKQHVMDSAALASAMNEIQKLKAQLVEKESESEAVQARDHAENTIENLRMELTETLSLVDKLKAELFDSRESEDENKKMLTGTQEQLDTTNVALEMLRLDKIKVSEAYNSVLMELEKSTAQVKSLEKLLENPKENDEVDRLKDELNVSSHEINQLKVALEAAERRYHEEYIQSTLQIRNAYEQVEAAKIEFSKREAELEEELKKTEVDTQNLKDTLKEMEMKLQEAVELNIELNSKIKEHDEITLEIEENQKEPEIANQLNKLEMALAEVKGNLMDKEMELQSVNSQNDMLKNEIGKMETEKNNIVDEAFVKLENVTEEAEKSSKRAASVAEQLEGVQETNMELETELRKLKVQCEQWRKAAEAAAGMLSGGKTGKHVERTGSLESPLTRRNVNSLAYLDDADGDDDGLPKKKNGNVLKKIGVLFKKGAEEKQLKQFRN